MERLWVARHGESELSARGILNGDPAVACGLTARGEQQALELGRLLHDEPLDVALTSDFDRCRATARLALAHRPVQLELVELPDLGDIRNGAFEGGRIDRYAEWARTAAPAESPPGGGESRTDAARRFAAGLRAVLDRPERCLLLVSHQLPLGFVLAGAEGRQPARDVPSVPYAQAVPLTHAQVARAAVTLEAWARRPR